MLKYFGLKARDFIFCLSTTLNYTYRVESVNPLRIQRDEILKTLQTNFCKTQY